jgi:glucose/arabinose dehydrogenase
MNLLRAVTLVLFVLFHASCGGSSPESVPKLLLADLPFPVRAVPLDGDTVIVAELATGVLFQFSEGTGERIDLLTFTSFSPEGDGISGLLVDRGYADNGYVYVYHTDVNGINVLTRLVLRDGLIFENRVIQTFAGKGSHNGGGMYQLPDGTILLGTGDGDVPAFAQDPDRLEGKIILLSREGEFLDTGNGFPPGVYAIGFRNPFGIDGNGDREIFVADNGPECDDEINRLHSGGNYGWRSGYVCGEHLPGHIAPIYVWNPSVGITDLVYVPSRKILLTSLFNLNSIRSLKLDVSGNRVVREAEILETNESVIGMSYYSDREIIFTTPTEVFYYRPDFTDPFSRL